MKLQALQFHLKLLKHVLTSLKIFSILYLLAIYHYFKLNQSKGNEYTSGLRSYGMLTSPHKQSRAGSACLFSSQFTLFNFIEHVEQFLCHKGNPTKINFDLALASPPTLVYYKHIHDT